MSEPAESVGGAGAPPLANVSVAGRRIAERLRAALGARAVAFFLTDPASAGLRPVEIASGPDVAPSIPVVFPRGTGVAGLAVERRQPIAIPDLFADPRVVLTPEVQAHLERLGHVAVLAVPLVVEDRVLGAISVADQRGRVFDDEDIRLAAVFADLAASTLENTGLLRPRAGPLRAFADAGRRVSESLDPAEVLRAITIAANELAGAEFADVWIADEAAGTLTLAASSADDTVRADFPHVTLAFGHGGVGWVAAQRRPLNIPDVFRDERYLARDWSRAHGITSFFAMPIALPDVLLGVMALTGRVPFVFTPDTERLLEGFAAQAAVAMKNARLYAESEQRRRVAEALAYVGRALAESLELATVGEHLVESVRRLLDARGALLSRVDPGSGALRVVASTAAGSTPLPVDTRLPAGGLTELAVRARGPMATTNVLDDPRLTMTPEARDRIGPVGGALLSVPLMARDAVIGALSIRDVAGRAFTNDEIRLAQVFADHAALVLENARLFHEEARRRRIAEAIAEVGQALSRTLDLDVVAQRIVETLIALLGAHSAVLYRTEPESSDLVARAVAGRAGALISRNTTLRRGTGVSGLAVARREVVASPRVLEDPSVVFPVDLRARAEAAGDRSVLSVPLLIRGRPAGALAVAGEAGRLFTGEEIALVRTFADQAAVAMENADLYREARAGQDRLIRGETLRALGELASGAAHHLNNILAVIYGRTSLLLARPLDEQLRRPLEIIFRATSDGAEVVRRIQQFARASPLHAQTAVDLNAIVAEVIELTRVRWEDAARVRGVSIDVTWHPGEIAEVAANAVALRELVTNFVLNAVDALEGGGRLALTTRQERASVVLRVADDGVGMPPDVLRRATEPFFTTKGVKSTGLGLSVSYGIVREHRGEMSIESREGGGTTVIVRLPVVEPRATASRSEAVPAPPPLRIVLVDDEPEVLEVFAELLTARGHTVTKIGAAREALAALDAGPRPDLLLTDLGMPDLTGWQVAAAAKQRWPGLAVGLLTGWGEAPEADPRSRGSVDFVLAKPLDTAALDAALASISPRVG